MLVLSRRIGEEIVIGDNIRVTVVAIRGNQVRLGFTAPPDVSIQRDELRALSNRPRKVIAGERAAPDLCVIAH